MQMNAVSMRPFIGSKDFQLSRNFYRDWGFGEVVLSHNLSLFQTDGLGFYLQDAYVQDWVDNTMLFLEVKDVDAFWQQLQAADLVSKYPGVKITPAQSFDWGKECFVHDPAGILWHVGEFSK